MDFICCECPNIARAPNHTVISLPLWVPDVVIKQGKPAHVRQRHPAHRQARHLAEVHGKVVSDSRLASHLRTHPAIQHRRQRYIGALVPRQAPQRFEERREKQLSLIDIRPARREGTGEGEIDVVVVRVLRDGVVDQARSCRVRAQHQQRSANRDYRAYPGAKGSNMRGHHVPRHIDSGPVLSRPFWHGWHGVISRTTASQAVAQRPMLTGGTGCEPNDANLGTVFRGIPRFTLFRGHLPVVAPRPESDLNLVPFGCEPVRLFQAGPHRPGKRSSRLETETHPPGARLDPRRTLLRSKANQDMVTR